MTTDTTTVFVTGAGGFVGQALTEALLIQGFKVRAFELTGSSNLKDLLKLGTKYPDLTVIEGDVRNKSSIFKAIGDATHVVHSAALLNSVASYQTFSQINVEGTRNALDVAIAKGVRRFLLVSTSDVFGIPKPDEVLSEASDYKPWQEPYADTKIQACKLVKSYHQTHHLEYTIIYPGWVYGPGDKQFFPAIIQMLEDKHVFLWHKKAPYQIDFIFIEDLVNAIIKALINPVARNEDFIILNEQATMTPEDVFSRMANHLKIPIKVHKIPYPLMMVVSRLSQWLCRKGITSSHLLSSTDVKAFGNNFRFTTDKARTLLDWQPEASEIEGIKRYFQWLENDARSSSTS